MARGTLGVIAGLAVWFIVVTVAGPIMRAAWPAYASVADAMTFTLPMMFARLSIGAFATLVMGYVTAVVARHSMVATLLSGVVLLLAFIPEHITLWSKFPIWYHLTFLLSLIPLSYVGGTIASARRSLVPAKA
ncbi:MAG TPA: hypothetical protein VKB50_32650 [Vicinamibacterales bacterium]|nr:hypothetical protein [Vicinamibacterales bacterium]